MRCDASSVDTDNGRYYRQILIPGFGVERQARVGSGSVFVAGLGGLGSPVALYLAAAGVGTITLADCQDVELSNLNRQILYSESDVGQHKASVAARRIEMLNSAIRVHAVETPLTELNVRDLIRGSDVVVDALDNWRGKLMLNSACVAENVPLVHGAVRGMYGQVTTVMPHRTACLSCILPKTPRRSSPTPVPVLGAAAGLVGCVQSMEVLKLLSGLGTPLTNTMLCIDAGASEFSTWSSVRSPTCDVCAQDGMT